MDAFEKETIERLARIEEQLKPITKFSDVILTIDKRSCKNEQDIIIIKGNMEDHEKRLDALEQQPVGRFNLIVNTGIAAIISGLVAYLLKK